jgi:uncharacterized protein with HEPN domain
MAASQNPALRLHHILDEAEAIQRATQGVTFDAFRDSWTLRRAVEHGFLIIAEASRALPSELKANWPAVPWARVEALGNILRHEYKDVDPAVLWRIIQEQLTDLRKTAHEMLLDLEP